MKPFCKFLYLLFLLGFYISGCHNNDYLYLKKVTIIKGSEIDTIEIDTPLNQYILNKIENAPLGNFTSNFIIVEKKHGGEIAYQIETDDKEWVRFSKDYIAFVKPYKQIKYGWVVLKHSQIFNDLPNINFYLDSIKKNSAKNCFIKVVNGYISLFINGENIKIINYGNLATKYKGLNFDSLDYKIYRLINDSLCSLSAVPDDIYKQRDGVYFIPPPGYSVIRKFNKIKVFQQVDSVYKLNTKPDEIKIIP